MTRNKRLLLLLIGLGLILSGCDLREGTIVYDVDFPKADSCESTGSCDSGGSNSGSGSGGAGSDGGSVTWDAVTSGEQQIELTWLAYSGASSYTIYWNTSGSVDNNSSSFSEISGTASTSCPGGAASCLSYNHGGLNSSAYYYYRIVANVSGKLTELSAEENASPLALSCTPSYTHDNDSDLLVYYDFNNNLEDQIDNYSDGRYDLTNTGGTIRFPAGCSDGLAGYFDSTSGYAYNNNFNDDNNSDLFESGNFTISMWFYADQDMAEFSSLMSSKYLPWKGDDDDKWSFQLDDNGAGQIRWRSTQGATSDDNRSTHTETSNTYSKSQWTHATFVKHDNGTSQIYLNGVLEATSSETQNTPLDSLRIGVNRYTDGNTDGKWKGYIDEFKVYGRALSEQEVVGACAAYTECKIPTNLSVTAGVEQNSLSWDAVSGATDYKIYWNTTGNVDSSSSSITVNGATTEDHISLTGGTTHYYRVSSVVGGVESALSVQQSATPLGSTKPTLTAVDNETQQVTINWNPVAGVDNYTIYWDTVSFTDNNSSNQILKVLGSSSGSVCSSGTCSYVHGGRDNGTTYYYRVAAVSAGGVAGARSNEASGTPRSFDGDPNCPRSTPNSDNDSALLVYYDFNVGLADQHRKYNDGRYDLSGADGFNLISAGSCFAGNRAGYFDSSGGYAFNDNFTSDNETALQDNFTISLWFNADQDMVDFSSLMSSRYVPDTGSDNDVWSFQIDSARRKKVSGTWTNGPWVRFRSAKGNASGDIDLYSQNQYNLHQWHHLAFVKYDNGTAILYLDNVSSSQNFNTSKMSSNIPPWSTLKIGTNRREEFNWKGYIDEFKVYGRALDADDVSNLYTRDYP
jgi:hypothetical protein